jgi:hypothetical protein
MTSRWHSHPITQVNSRLFPCHHCHACINDQPRSHGHALPKRCETCAHIDTPPTAPTAPSSSVNAPLNKQVPEESPLMTMLVLFVATTAALFVSSCTHLAEQALDKHPSPVPTPTATYCCHSFALGLVCVECGRTRNTVWLADVHVRLSSNGYSNDDCVPGVAPGVREGTT